MASTINCGCHSIRSMFRVLGIYNFGYGSKFMVVNLISISAFFCSRFELSHKFLSKKLALCQETVPIYNYSFQCFYNKNAAAPTVLNSSQFCLYISCFLPTHQFLPTLMATTTQKLAQTILFPCFFFSSFFPTFLFVCFFGRPLRTQSLWARTIQQTFLRSHMPLIKL